MAFDFDAFVRLIHVFGAALWFGGGLFFLLRIAPAVADAGPAGNAVMGKVLARGGLGGYFGPIGLLTILAGLYLYWAGGFHSAAFDTTANAMITIGMVLGLVALGMALGISKPTEKKMGELMASFPKDGPPSAEQAGQMAELAAKNLKAGQMIVTVLGIAIVLMAGRTIFS